MKRLLLVCLVLASCSKAKKDAAPANSQPVTTQAPTGGSEDRGRTALEEARNQGGLGVSGDTTAFEPIEGSGNGKAGPTKPSEQPNVDRKVQPVAGGAAGYLATIESVTVDGKPAAAEITQAVSLAVTEIQGCYDKARATSTKKKDIAGTLKIAFTVIKTGAVFSAAIEGKSLGEFDMENCVMGALSRIKLAKPPADKVNAVATITFAKK